MKNFLRIASGVDVMPLRLAIKRQPWLWNQYSLRATSEGSPHTGMRDIWLRYNAWENFKGDRAAFNAEHDSVNYPAWYALPEAAQIIYPLMAQVKGLRLGGVLITQIPPGGEIAAHTDTGWHVEYYSKYYVQIDSAPRAEFWCEDEVLVPMRGDIWLFDNRKEHGVRNLSNEVRTTMIVCIKSDEYPGAKP